jgi:two-component system sensor histidine kinase/response regulator
MNSASVILAIGFPILRYACFWLYRKANRKVSGNRLRDGQYDKYFHRLLDETVIAYHDLDRNGIIQRVKRAECNLLGYEPEQLIGRPVYELVAPGAKAESKRAVSGKLSGRIPLAPFQREYRRRDGTQLTVEIHENILFDEHENVIGLRSALIDVSERVRAEAELVQNKRLFEEMAKSAPVKLWITNNAGHLIFGNDVAKEFSAGWQHFLNTHDPVSADRKTEIFQVEFQSLRADGELRWLLISSVPRFSTDGGFEGWIGSAIDITERRESEERLRLLESVVVNATEGVMITDAELDDPGPRILYVNKSFTEATGYELSDVQGKNPRILQGQLTDKTQLATLRAAMQDGKPVELELLNYRKDGRPFWNEMHVVPVIDADGNRTHCIALQRDVTDRKRVENEIQRYARELKQNNHALGVAASSANESTELKSRFLANMSHEIRTPMNGIIGMVDLLLTTQLSGEQLEYAHAVRQSANSLLVVINDILDISRIEAGKLELDCSAFHMPHLVAEAIAPLAVTANGKGLALKCEILGDIHENIIGDPTRIRQVITNLVGNAIKFTETGHVNVSVQRLESTSDSVSIKMSIADSGVGIPADQLARLFHRFSQADNPLARKQAGSGLGLSISRQLVEMMGGSIGVETEAGIGSTFWFTLTLPTEKPSGTVRNESALELPEAVEKPDTKRILIAEDNEINRRIALRILEKSGFAAEAVGNGRLALEALKHDHYDLVLMDVQMPEMDGFEATTAIRNLASAVREIPIIAMTANAMEGDREKCIASGMDDYISKPVSLLKLQTALDRWIQKRPTTPESPAHP